MRKKERKYCIRLLRSVEQSLDIGFRNRAKIVDVINILKYDDIVQNTHSPKNKNDILSCPKGQSI